MAAGDVYRMVVSTTQLGSFYMNTYAVQCIAAPPPTLAQATTLATDLKEAFRPLQAQSLIYRGWKLYQIGGSGVTYDPVLCKREGGLILEGTYTGTLTGGDAIDPLAPQLAMTVTLYSNMIGRRRRGRVYLPGWSENAQSGGNWTSGVLTSVTTALATLYAKYGSDPSGTDPIFRLGIWSERTAFGCEPSETHPHDPVRVDPPNPDAAFIQLARWVPRPIVYTQRRRTLGVGR